jgi:glycolate oxidase
VPRSCGSVSSSAAALSGEHGVGVEKRDLMTTQFRPADLDQQRRIKTAFDPGWILNPHKVFPLVDA